MDAWHSLNKETIGSPAYWDIALQTRATFEHLLPVIKEHAFGDILDYGAGQLAWRDALRAHGKSYFSFDIYDAHPELDLVAPFPQRGGPLPDASCDTVFCCSVLEHARDPLSLMTDMRRILRTDGVAIICVPFIYYLHGAPYDYWRFTRFGLEELITSSGFSLVKMHTLGNYLYHILNIPSIASSCLLWRLKMKKLIKPTTAFWYGIYKFLSGKAVHDTWAVLYTVVLRKTQ